LDDFALLGSFARDSLIGNGVFLKHSFLVEEVSLTNGTCFENFKHEDCDGPKKCARKKDD
jgi:hypothetical protein